MNEKNAGSDKKNDKPDSRTIKSFESKLTEAVRDLFYISETDAGFEVVLWKPQAGAAAFSNANAALLLRLAKKDAQTPVREQTLEDFFRFPTTEQDWHTDEDKAVVRRYRDLQKLLAENLRDAKVFKTGAVEIDVYIVGIDKDGNLAGVKTSGVET